MLSSTYTSRDFPHVLDEVFKWYRYCHSKYLKKVKTIYLPKSSEVSFSFCLWHGGRGVGWVGSHQNNSLKIYMKLIWCKINIRDWNTTNGVGGGRTSTHFWRRSIISMSRKVQRVGPYINALNSLHNCTWSVWEDWTIAATCSRSVLSSFSLPLSPPLYRNDRRGDRQDAFSSCNLSPAFSDFWSVNSISLVARSVLDVRSRHLCCH